MYLQIDMDLELPKNEDSIKGIKQIFLNIEITGTTYTKHIMLEQQNISAQKMKYNVWDQSELNPLRKLVGYFYFYR